MLNICNKIFSSWNDKKVKYCHWKSNEHLEEGLNGETDLDLFIAPEDKSLACEVLNRLDVIKCNPLRSNQYPNVEEWIGFDSETGKLIHLHIHYSIITGKKFCKEYVFPLDSVLIDNRVINESYNVYVASPEVELIILYSRICLKANNAKTIKLDDDYIKEIEYLKQRYSQERLISICYEQPAIAELPSYVAKDDLSESEWYKVDRMVRKWLKPYKKYGDIYSSVRSTFFRMRNNAVLGLNKYCSTSLLCRKTIGEKGVIICFIGQDGSGKSTLTTEICKWLNWKLEAKRFYLGSGDHYHSVFKTVQENTGSRIKEVEPKGNEDNQSKRHRSVLSWISMMLSSLNLVHIAKRAYRIVNSAKRYVNKGGIALFDRYPQDQFEGVYDGPKIATSYINKGRSNRFVKMCYKKEKKYIGQAQAIHPTVIFKLKLPVEESLRRKPEENFDNLTIKHRITEQLTFPASDLYEIDATQDYSIELIQVKNILWNAIVKSQL